jgi:signal transduction histidine kinase
MSPPKPNCWDVLGCGRGPGGPRADDGGPCPAATDATADGINGGLNAGRFCWTVPGTRCHDRLQGGLDEKREECSQCRFFRQVKYEEGAHFQLLKPALENTDPRELHRQLNNVIRLIGIGRDILANLAVRPLLARITEHACAVTGASSAAAYRVADSGEALILAAHAGTVTRPERIRLDEASPVVEAARTRRLCCAQAAVAGHSGLASVAAIPIGGPEETTDVLELVKTGAPFSADDEWFLREFGLIASLGIANARHVEDLRELRQFNKAKSRFVALLMHHIASPLATIACSLQALSQLGDNLSNDDRGKLIANSLDRIQSIQTLARQLLDLAAIRSGAALAKVRPVSLAEAVRQEVDAHQAAARKKGVEVVLAGDRGDARVSADPDGLRLIFGNLIGNAIKYSAGPGKAVHVDLCTEGNCARVRIQDQGIGIPQEEQARVFEEFHRGSNVTRAHTTGSGFGLAVVKELADRYGAGIELQSEVGAGTTVTVTFPLAGTADRTTPAP